MSNVVPINARGTATPPTARPATTTRTTPAVYTVAEVAELLGLALGSTYAMVRSGEIPAKRVGGRWVIPRRRFHAWLDDLPEATDAEVARELARTTGGDQ